MLEERAFTDLMHNPVYRRTWLLYKALETVPLNRAIELARDADGFVTGSSPTPSSTDSSVAAAAQSSVEDDHGVETVRAASTEKVTTAFEEGGAPLRLSAEQREQLVQRFADGATNAALSKEFGISAKQVQGFRMGSVRMAKRRGGVERKQSLEDMRAASADEVVRYLRQQDDVVVPRGEGQYLVNGRFELSLASLVDRANRMLSRQGKPRFEVESNYTTTQISAANGHAKFST